MSETIVYGKTTCPYCVRAKEILAEQGVAYREVLFGSPEFPNKQVLEEALGVQIQTVPQIVLNGEYIGGCDKLAAKFGVPVWPQKGV